MFAYCGNNPINRCDPTGYCPNALHGKLSIKVENALMCTCSGGGGAGGAAAAIGIGVISVLITVIVYTGTEILRYTQENLQHITQTISDIIAKTAQRERQYQYWEAWRVKNNVIIGRGLTFPEATARVACGLDIMCANEGAAKWLLVINGYWNPVGPEIHGEDGFYYHYHPNRNSHTHIWFN